MTTEMLNADHSFPVPRESLHAQAFKIVLKRDFPYKVHFKKASKGTCLSNVFQDVKGEYFGVQRWALYRATVHFYNGIIDAAFKAYPERMPWNFLWNSVLNASLNVQCGAVRYRTRDQDLISLMKFLLP